VSATAIFVIGMFVGSFATYLGLWIGSRL